MNLSVNNKATTTKTSTETDSNLETDSIVEINSTVETDFPIKMDIIEEEETTEVKVQTTDDETATAEVQVRTGMIMRIVYLKIYKWRILKMKILKLQRKAGVMKR